MGCRLILFFLAAALCIPSLAEQSGVCMELDVSQHESLTGQGDTLTKCTSAFLAVVGKALQLEDRLRHYDFQQSTAILFDSWLSTLQLGAIICLLVVLADNARLRRQASTQDARFNAREVELKSICNGIRLQATDLGERAVQGCQEKAEVVMQYNILVDKSNVMLLVLRNALHRLENTQEALKKAQVAAASVEVSPHCQTVDLDILAPASPVSAEASSPNYHPQLEAEASTPELSDLVSAAAHHDTVKRKTDQVNATPATLKGTAGLVSTASKLESVQADVESLNQHLEEQGAPYRVMLTPSAITPSAAVEPHTCRATAATAMAPAGVGTVFKSPLSATSDMLPLPSQDAAVFHSSSPQGGLLVPVEQQSVMPTSSASGGQGSKFVTHDELKLMMLQTECQKLKEENKLLKKEVKVQHVTFQSPGITPLTTSYVNTRRGAATPPMPLHFASGGMPGSAGSFVSMASGNALNVWRSSTDMESSAAASSSYFKAQEQSSQQQIPGSAGSTKTLPPGQAAAGMVLTPGSSATSCSGMRRTPQHTTPVPMQPLTDAPSPTCSPIRPQLTRSPAKESAAKKLSDAIDVFAKKPTRIRELADKSSKAAELQSNQKPAA